VKDEGYTTQYVRSGEFGRLARNQENIYGNIA
jgi:hypothetical protein